VGETVAVFDTNVMVSGFLSPHGPPGFIVDWLREGTVRAAVEDRIVAEYREVLKRPEFGLPAAEVDIALDEILYFAVWPIVPPGCVPGRLPDPHDLPFAECAAAARCPLVTGNVRHFPKEILGQPILTPAQFVSRVSASGGSASGLGP
jgi:predicted nucleic acid-binding protein